MFRIRRVPDDTTPANRQAIEQAQAILREQFAAMPAADIDKLPEQLSNPLKYSFRTLLLVAEDARDRLRGCAVLLHAPDLNFCLLETIASAPGAAGGGVGAALYERVRELAHTLGAVGIFFECLPDDPALSPDPDIRKQNIARLRFYERFGARPIAGTAYETPLRPGDTDPPYLMFDRLGTDTLPPRDRVRTIVRAFLERKYSAVCPPGYIDMVVDSFRDDPIVLRPPRYLRKHAYRAVSHRHEAAERIPMAVNDKHEIHHVRDRGYVQAPVRIRSILGELDKSGLVERIPVKRYPDRHIRAVHDGALVDYLERACLSVEPGKSLYPYVFPIRNAARPPRERTVAAGYYCIDTFTPLNANAWHAARGAVDCALTAADRVLEGSRLGYALVRPPGHHAERKAFGGFCYFNNAAIAANHLSRFGRVAVLDIDYHHGNGTQDIFYDRSDVLTISIHGHPSFAYPYFSGFREETGVGAGAGFNLNIPLAEHTTPDQHREAVQRAIRRIRSHDPAYLVLALGLDTAKGDPTGTWSNGAADFEKMGELLGGVGLPTLVVQEGGYRVRTLGLNARHFLKGLSDAALRTTPAMPRSRAAAPVAPVRLEWRDTLRRADIEQMRSLAATSGVFSTAQSAVAVQGAEDRVERGAESGNQFVVAEESGRMVGYACFGPAVGTTDRFELTFLVVERGHWRSGIGRELLSRVEAAITARDGKRAYVGVSSAQPFRPARSLLTAAHYRKVGELPDYYGKGEGRSMFVKAFER